MECCHTFALDSHFSSSPPAIAAHPFQTGGKASRKNMENDPSETLSPHPQLYKEGEKERKGIGRDGKVLDYSFWRLSSRCSSRTQHAR